MSIKKRLEALEQSTPPGIVLTLDDGTKIEYPGSALEFYADALEQIARKRGSLFDLAHRLVGATGCGKLHEVLLAMIEGPVEQRISKRSGTASGSAPKRSALS